MLAGILFATHKVSACIWFQEEAIIQKCCKKIINVFLKKSRENEILFIYLKKLDKKQFTAIIQT